MFATKAVQVSGNLSSNQIVYRLCPPNEFSEGVWNVAIANVGYESNENLNVFCTVSCNLVQSQKISDSNQVISYQMPLTAFLIKTVATVASGSLSFYRFDPIWFRINSFSDQLRFTFTNPKTNQTLLDNCNVYLTVLFLKN